MTKQTKRNKVPKAKHLTTEEPKEEGEAIVIVHVLSPLLISKSTRKDPEGEVVDLEEVAEEVEEEASKGLLKRKKERRSTEEIEESMNSLKEEEVIGDPVALLEEEAELETREKVERGTL